MNKSLESLPCWDLAVARLCRCPLELLCSLCRPGTFGLVMPAFSVSVVLSLSGLAPCSLTETPSTHESSIEESHYRLECCFIQGPETSNGTRGNDTEHATIQHRGLQVQRVSVIQAHSMQTQATGLLGLPRSSNVLHCRLIFLNTGPGTRYSPQPGADSVEGDKVRKRTYCIGIVGIVYIYIHIIRCT